MARNSSLRRIAVVNQPSAEWVAASTYTRMILRSLEAVARPAEMEIFFISNSEHLNLPPGSTAKLIELATPANLPAESLVRKTLRLGEKSAALPGEARLRRTFGLNDNSNPFAAATLHNIDVLLPLLDVPPWPIGAKTIGWIPDFQHLFFAELFNQSDLDRRNETVSRLADRATLIMLSSNAARDDFATVAPAAVDKVRVIPFPSLFAFESFAGDAAESRRRFNLPEKFALVSNQFWAHKNHAVVVAALAHLKKRGVRVPVVMTGQPSDWRDPANKNFSSLLQAIAAAGLNDQITILGQVPYGDLVNLMKTAAVILQPSRFEGWSTVVQDAKALGRPVICSDIAVHREQAPAALAFFPCDAPEVLAEVLAAHWPNLIAGPDPNAEAQSLQNERSFAQRHGEMLLAVCQEAMNINA